MFSVNDYKLNGYRPSHRNKWRLIQYEVLTVQQLCLLEFYADIFDFDKRHVGYGMFGVDFSKIATIFNKSENTIRNWHKKLLKLRFIKKTPHRNIFTLTSPDRYVSTGRWEGRAAECAKQEKNQPTEVVFQNMGINLQKIEKKLQPVVKNNSKNLKKTPAIVLNSFKDKSNINPNNMLIQQKVRSEEEYQEIHDRGGYQYLTTDDMRWIDKNVKEKVKIQDKQIEKDIADIFFKKN